MCSGTCSHRARPPAAYFLFARVRILPEGFYNIGNEVSYIIKTARKFNISWQLLFASIWDIRFVN